jgi:plasmid maintenance system antidote protein VapI
VPTVSLAMALRLLIQESGLSKRCIARRAGVHYEIVLRFMRSERAVSMATADKILAALNTTCKLEKEAKT